MEFVIGIILVLTFFGLAYYCVKGHNLMIGFLIISYSSGLPCLCLGAAGRISRRSCAENPMPASSAGDAGTTAGCHPEQDLPVRPRRLGHHAGQRLLGRLVRPRPDGDRHRLHPDP